MGIVRERESLPLRMVVGLNEVTGPGTQRGSRNRVADRDVMGGSGEGPHAPCPASPAQENSSGEDRG